MLFRKVTIFVGLRFSTMTMKTATFPKWLMDVCPLSDCGGSLLTEVVLGDDYEDCHLPEKADGRLPALRLRGFCTIPGNAATYKTM
jgi:hypothetical protein